ARIARRRRTSQPARCAWPSPARKRKTPAQKKPSERLAHDRERNGPDAAVARGGHAREAPPSENPPLRISRTSIGATQRAVNQERRMSPTTAPTQILLRA